MVKILFFISLIIFPAFSYSAGYTGPRSLLEVGCHNGDGTCYLVVDGAAFGESSCMGSSLRWDASTKSGRNVLGVLNSAFIAGRKVDFYVSPGCYLNQPAFPTFSWFNVK